VSEQLPFGPVDGEPATANDGRRKIVAIAGIAAVVAALGVSAFLFLGGSGGASPAAGAGAVALPPSSSKSAHPSVTPTVAPTIPIAATEPNRHDPFKPLYTPKPVPVTTTPASTTPSGGLPSGSPGGTVGPGGTPGATQNVVKLVSISGDTAPTVSVQIDGKPFLGKTNDILGSVLRVVSIRTTDGAATFQLGDATFDLHIGQSYTN
jgi:hypothetical protein